MSRIGVLLWTHGTGADRGVRKVRLPCRRRRTRRLNGDDLSWHISARIAARFAISGLGLSQTSFVRQAVHPGRSQILPPLQKTPSSLIPLCKNATDRSVRRREPLHRPHHPLREQDVAPAPQGCRGHAQRSVATHPRTGCGLTCGRSRRSRDARRPRRRERPCPPRRPCPRRAGRTASCCRPRRRSSARRRSC